MKKMKKGNRKPKPGMDGRITINTNNQVVLIPLRDILYIQANRSYATVNCKSGESRLHTKPMCTLEKELPEDYFIKSHRSYIINVIEVKAFSKTRRKILLSNDTNIPISHRRCRNVIKFIEGYSG